MLLGAGASLAAAFLERRMAAGDPVVLQRLMMLLTAPLSGMEEQSEVHSFPYIPHMMSAGMSNLMLIFLDRQQPWQGNLILLQTPH